MGLARANHNADKCLALLVVAVSLASAAVWMSGPQLTKALPSQQDLLPTSASTTSEGIGQPMASGEAITTSHETPRAMMRPMIPAESSTNDTTLTQPTTLASDASATRAVSTLLAFMALGACGILWVCWMRERRERLGLSKYGGIEPKMGTPPPPDLGRPDRGLKSSRPSIMPPAQPKPVKPPKAVEVTLPSCHAACLAPFIYNKKGEDYIFSGLVADRWPSIVIADGASSMVFLDGTIGAGGGRRAAKQAVDITRQRLEEVFSETPTLPEVAEAMREIFRAVDQTLREDNTQAIARGDAPGGTTLLVGFLYEPPGTKSPYWCYAYLGDGYIVLMSPSRNLGDRLATTYFVTAHTNGDTTLALPLPEKLKNFEPVIGSVAYCPGDILYVASDGLNAVSKYLERYLKITVSHYLWKKSFEKSPPRKVPQLPDILHDPDLPTNTTVTLEDTLRDDTTLGVIWTEQVR